MSEAFAKLSEYIVNYPFVQYAFIAGILIALCSSLLGVTLVLKRFSFIGDGLSHVAFGAMAIAAVLQVLGIIDPGLRGQVLHPPMSSAAMIGHHVHDDLQPLVVSLLNESPVEFVGSVAGIDEIIVGAGIAVIGVFLFVVQKQRCRPDGGGAKADQVVEVVDDALDVAAVTAAEVLGVGLFHCLVRSVVFLVAIGETVGHQKVYGILRAEGLALG